MYGTCANDEIVEVVISGAVYMHLSEFLNNSVVNKFL